MAAELKDLRARITPEAWAVLKAKAISSGKDMEAIHRDLLHRWALEEINKASVMQRYLRANGIDVDRAGTQRNDSAGDWQDTQGIQA